MTVGHPHVAVRVFAEPRVQESRALGKTDLLKAIRAGGATQHRVASGRPELMRAIFVHREDWPLWQTRIDAFPPLAAEAKQAVAGPSEDFAVVSFEQHVHLSSGALALRIEPQSAILEAADVTAVVAEPEAAFASREDGARPFGRNGRLRQRLERHELDA